MQDGNKTRIKFNIKGFKDFTYILKVPQPQKCKKRKKEKKENARNAGLKKTHVRVTAINK